MARLEMGLHFPDELKTVNEVRELLGRVFQLPMKITGTDASIPLIDIGNRVTEAYMASTTRIEKTKPHPVSKWWVEAGSPIVIVETSAALELPQTPPPFVPVEDGSIAAWHQWFEQDAAHRVGVWFLRYEAGSNSDVLRSVRLHILRLHDERETLRKVLQMVSVPGRFFTRLGPESSNFLGYVNNSIARLEKKSYYGIPQSPLLQQVADSDGKFNAGDTETVLPELYGLRDEAVRRIAELSKPTPPPPPTIRKRRLVILVHGIRTRAEWEGRIRHLLEEDGQTDVETLGYGYFDVFRFLSPLFTRRGPVNEVLRQIRAAVTRYPNRNELVLVGHSFGTYILGTILRKNPDIRPDRVLFCGSILSRAFDWEIANQPKEVLNEAGSRDIWPILAKSITWGYGSTGTFGFQKTGVRDRFHNLAHSDYFKTGFAEEYWVPWIRDGVRKPTPYETSERPPTPLFKNLLESIPLKWLLLIGLIFVAAKHWRLFG